MESRAIQRTVITGFFIICMVILAGRLVFLQLINKEYKITASNNVLRYWYLLTPPLSVPFSIWNVNAWNKCWKRSTSGEGLSDTSL